MENPVDQLHKIRHSAAHVLAEAVTTLFPEALPTIGPVTDDGFFYDFFIESRTISETDLVAIEAKMREIIARNHAIEGKQVAKDEALKMYAHNKFKREIIEQLEGATVGIYWQGEFFDLCRGGHTESTGQVLHFKLTSVAGAFWRADSKRESLQRIYGIAFATAEDLEQYLYRLEQAKLYDHRLLGKNLDLFSILPEAPGCVFYHDKGTFVFNQLVEFSRQLQKEAGYLEVRTPVMLKESLWHTSGHYDCFKENMFFVQNAQEEKFALRPMNCPGAMLMFASQLRSYRELPMRIAEYGLDHRNELSGVLHGLFRVRAFTQDDAHIFCSPAQIEEVVLDVLQLAAKIYAKFGFTKVRMALSTKPAKALGSDELWETATNALANALQKLGHEIFYQHGEGAFYGPKIEIKITDAIGREWQCGTVQVDFNLPERFQLEFVGSDQQRHTPVVVHRAIYGSIERFFGMLLEHCKGVLPFWITPVQAVILPITDGQNAYARELQKQLANLGLRVEVDLNNEKISAKIRTAQLNKVPWMLVVGKREQEASTMTLRALNGEQTADLTVEALQALYEKEL